MSSLDGTSSRLLPGGLARGDRAGPRSGPTSPWSSTCRVVLLATVPWTLGIAALARVTLPSSGPGSWAWSAVLSGAGLSLPLYLAIGPSGVVANAVALACFPGVLAVVLALPRQVTWRTVGLAVLAVVGLALTHPNVALTLAIAAAPPLAVALWPWLRTTASRPRAAVAIAALTVVLARGRRADRALGPLGHRRRDARAADPQGLDRTILDFLSGEVGTTGMQAGLRRHGRRARRAGSAARRIPSARGTAQQQRASTPPLRPVRVTAAVVRA